MTQAEATELLNQRLLAEWVAAHPTVRYALNNETFKPTTRPFARFIVAGIERIQRSMGPVGRRRFEYRGSFVAQLFSDLNQGTLPLDTLVGSVHLIFGSKHLSTASDPMWTKGGTVSNPVQREGLHMVVVSTPLSWFNWE